MTGTPLVSFERLESGVALVSFANGKVNSLSIALLGELQAAVEELRAAPPGAVVVTGGDRMFAAGADVDELGGPAEAKRVADAFAGALEALASFPRATVAAISGYALGGGCELALACDLRIASPSARLGLPEILLGIIPGGGGTQRLARLVGPAKAKDLVLTGRQVRAAEALSMGLVDEVVPAEEVVDRALEKAAELAKGAVVAQGLAKRAIDDGLDLPLEAGLALERELFVEVASTQDSQTGLASFRDQGPGKAKFAGR